MRYMLSIPCILLSQQTYAANSSLPAENSSCISFKDNNAILSLDIELLMNIEVAHIDPKNRSWSRTPRALPSVHKAVAAAEMATAVFRLKEIAQER